jgi:histidinol-phosphatase (PHP family)
MPHDKLDEYVEKLSALKKQYDDENFQLKIGLEVDFFYENIDSVIKHLKQYDIDYLIGSVHYTGVFSVDHDIVDWLPLSLQEREQVCKDYWHKVKGAAACKAFDFLGHLDLTKKFGLINNDSYLEDALQVLDIVAQRGGAIELNTSGWFKQCAEQYPSASILQAAAVRKIPVVISSDAHCAEHITRNFNEAKAVLQKAGCSISSVPNMG